MIDLCEVTPLCTDTATWLCRISKSSGAVSRPIMACTDHRRALEAEAAESGQTVSADPVQRGEGYEYVTICPTSGRACLTVAECDERPKCLVA